MKILITGVSGFIGYHLANSLLDKGHEVVGIDNFFRGKWDEDFSMLSNRKNFSLYDGDLTDIKAWYGIPGKFDHVYHLAAINGTKLFYELPHEVLRVNILTTLNAVEWMRTCNPSGKFLFTSSNEAYASALEAFGILPIPTPENVPLVVSDVLNPRWTYGSTKLTGEQLTMFYAKHYGFRYVIVRPHNFYGPRAGFHHVIPDFIDRIEKRTDPFPIFGGNQTRTFCYIDDAVNAMQLLMDAPHTDNKIYNISADPTDEITMRDLAESLFSIAKWKPSLIVPEGHPEGSVLRRAGDISRIKSDIGWGPQVTLRDGLEKTYVWYRARYAKS